jgi:hypothetical protein
MFNLHHLKDNSQSFQQLATFGFSHPIARFSGSGLVGTGVAAYRSIFIDTIALFMQQLSLDICPAQEQG